MSNGGQDWYLRHRDQVEHGPFELATLVDAARRGDIAEDTEVRHEKHTRGTWVLATRVSAISKAMPTNLQPISPPALPDQAPEIRPEPSVFIRSEAPAVVEPRSSRQSMKVPKNLTSAFFAIFDFRFRYFITPWIVRIQWMICVVTGILILGVGSFAMVVSPLLESSPTQYTPGFNGGDYTPPRLQQPRSTTSSWISKAWNSGAAHAMGYIAFVASVLSWLLILRLLLEFVIVFFRIAEDMGDVKSSLDKLEANSRS